MYQYNTLTKTFSKSKIKQVGCNRVIAIWLLFIIDIITHVDDSDDDIVIPQSSRHPPQQNDSQVSVADSAGTEEDVVITTTRPKSVARSSTSVSNDYKK